MDVISKILTLLSNETNLIFLYGTANGVFFAVAFIPMLISMTYINKRYDWRIALTFFLFGASFFCFGLYNLFFQYANGAVTSSLLPLWIFDLGRIAVLLTTAVLTFVFTRALRMRSRDAYEFNIRYLNFEYALYVFYGALVFVLWFIKDAQVASALIMISFIPSVLFMLLMARANAKNRPTGYLLTIPMYLLFFASVGVSVALIIGGLNLKEPYAVLLHLLFAFVMGFICVVMLRFGYVQISRFSKVRLLDKYDVVNEILPAIENNQLELHFQPQFDLESKTLFGAEALVRWRHPKKGLIPPAGFIALAEHVELIDHIAEWVIKETLQVCRKLLDNDRRISFSINFSVMNLNDRMVCVLAEGLQQYDVPAELVNIEITETLILSDEDEQVERALKRLHELGVSLTIDDYGAGFSSLSYFNRFAVDELKIDRQFVTDLLTSKNSYEIVKSTVQMTKNLGMRSVAEGVEDEGVLRLLHELGCDLAQGYAIARPMPLAELLEWLNKEEKNTRQMLAVTV